MLALPQAVKIYLASGATDLRKSFDGLSGVTRTVLEENPASGHLFVFCNRRKDRLKVLYFDGSGLWVFAKRLEKGTFCWPNLHAETRVQLRSSELTLLLAGIDYSGEWFCRVGLPAKSGVGGGIVAVAPGKMAIATFSPALDKNGNSVRGILAIQDIAKALNLHVLRSK